MTISVLLRLRSELLHDGSVCGQAEVVDTGETRSFGDVRDLIEFLQASVASVANPLSNRADPDLDSYSGERTIS